MIKFIMKVHFVEVLYRGARARDFVIVVVVFVVVVVVDVCHRRDNDVV